MPRKSNADKVLQQLASKDKGTLDAVSSLSMAATKIGTKTAMSSTESRKIPIFEIDPKRCKPWKFHNRDRAWLNEKACEDLISSIKANGQIEPVLVRKISSSNYDFEIIYGVRRWYACSQIPGQMLKAKISEDDDKQCMILMHIENADSQDISDFERAYSFSKQMKSGCFESQLEFAKALNVSKSNMSRMLKAAEIFDYPWLRKLFISMVDIPVFRAAELATLLKNPHTLSIIKERASVLLLEMEQGHSMGALNILKILSSSGKGEDGVDKKIDSHLEGFSCKLDSRGRLIMYLSPKLKSVSRKEVDAAVLRMVGEFIE